MRGMLGLIIAAALGALAVGVNMAYLHNKTKNADMVEFVGVREGATIDIGTMIKTAHLQAVPVPRTNARSMENHVYQWRDRNLLVGMPSTKVYRGGELVFTDDYKTPLSKLQLDPSEMLYPVNVTNKSPLIEPGSFVMFQIPLAPALPMNPNTNPDGTSPPPVMPETEFELVGPFEVAAIGNRIGDREVMKAYKIPQINENQLGIILNVEPPHDKHIPDALGQQLLEALSRANSRSVNVLLLPPKAKK